jgi:molecular chaperone DnaK
MPDVQAVGIDLGTTNSAVAWVDQSGRTAMLLNGDGDLLTPSVVFFDDAEIIVGKEAFRAAAAQPDRVAQWVKRDMGSPVYSRPIRGQYLPPEVIQSCILRRLRGDIVAAVGTAAKAVITVPAYFDEPRRKATADAGEMAGLSLADIVNEPTAAALAFGEVLGYLSPAGKVLQEMVVMVYDLGGGTFDATLLRLAPGDVRTLATDGDVQLGGHDWDARLVAHAAEAFKQLHGCDPRDDPSALNRLYADIVEAKHALSARARTVIRVEYQGRTAEIPIAREQFEEMTGDLLERTAYTIRQLLAAARLQWKDVSRVLLVGGSTRMPMVSRKLQELTGIVPDRTVNPDEAVARGASIYCKYLLSSAEQGGAGSTFQVTNVNSHSLGIEGIDPHTLRKINVILIPRNTALPAKCAEKFMTKSEGQRSIVLQVLEGESSLPGECTAIGRTVIRDLPDGLPKNWPIDVTFEYATNGRLMVRAVVPGTHRETLLELERDVGLSLEGISRWKLIVGGMAGFAQFEGMLDEVLHMPALARGLAAGRPFVAPPGAAPPGAVAADTGGRWDSGPTRAAPLPAMPLSGGLSPPFLTAPFAQPRGVAPDPGPILFPPMPEMPQQIGGPTESTVAYMPSPLAQTSEVSKTSEVYGQPAPGPFGFSGPASGALGDPQAVGGTSPMEMTPGVIPPAGMAAHPAGAINLSDLGIEVSKPRRRMPRWVLGVIGYGTSAVLGLGLAYFLLRWLFPGSRLPSLW